MRNYPNSGVRLETLDALRHRVDDREVRTALREAMVRDRNPGVRLKAFEALRVHHAEPDIRQALKQVLRHDETPGMRIQVIDSLSQIPDRELIGLLQELVESDQNDYVRLKCRRTLREPQRFGGPLLMLQGAMRPSEEKILGGNITHQLVWTLASVALAQTLPAQTVSPVEKQGRYWVQTEEGSLPAGTRLRVSSTGHITVTGGEWKKVGYKLVKKLRARSRHEAAQLLGSARVKAALQGDTAVVSVIAPNCYPVQFHRQCVDFRSCLYATNQLRKRRRAQGDGRGREC